SVLGLVFPDIFPEQFKGSNGVVHVYFEAVAVILTLALMGQVLEARAHRKTNAAVKELIKLSPSQATRIINGIEVLVDIDLIEKGHSLRVKPGDKIPVDGFITEGESYIDESMITGEPSPVFKVLNEIVTAGTINGNQSFIMQADRVGAETLLAQIIDMVNKASRSQAPIQKLADRISSYFVPIVVGISILTFIVWSIWGPDPAYVFALVNAIAVLIIACPCALGLATPMSVMVGIGKAARNGILVKNAEAIQQMNKIDTLIVDKTATLTEGKPSVENLVSLTENYDEKTILLWMASVNQSSEHPLAEACLEYAKKKHIIPEKVGLFQSVPGQGVKAFFNKKRIAIGNQKLMTSIEISIPESIQNEIKQLQKKAKTISYLSVDAELVAYIVLSDQIKETSRQAISELNAKGIEVIMLTGDNTNTAKAVAKELGIHKFEAEQYPHDKLQYVEQIQKAGHVVAMAGDGINDAPALAKSDIGIAMGTGTGVAIESADMTLIKGDLLGIVKAKNLSDAVMKNIKQNLFFALAYNTIGVPIAAGILYPMFGLLLSPMIAALAMSFSSVSVIGNALRLRSKKI
ncbi:copper-translocating P-type ATPase, partial [Saprospiraceae bacterium]|nr:copper-translocating P-type ATPase [Saprospiraceae bacterium]